jgi:hypothetical protein
MSIQSGRNEGAPSPSSVNGLGFATSVPHIAATEHEEARDQSRQSDSGKNHK